MGGVLSVHNLSASYGGPAVLEGIDFTVPAGSSVGVIGPNGSGKTTLFKALVGTAQTTAGSFTAPNQIAYVPQIDRSRHDFPVTALDVVLMGLYPTVPWWKPLGRQAKQQATAVMAQLDIDSLTDIQFGQLSGGQRQRVLVAKALVQQTDLILMDEPFSNTDPISSRLIEQAIESSCKSGKVILISTHDVQQARQWDLVLCLNKRQLAFGPPQPALTDAVLRSTYGGELINLGQGEAIVVTHHHHQHSHPNEGHSRD